MAFDNDEEAAQPSVEPSVIKQLALQLDALTTQLDELQDAVARTNRYLAGLMFVLGAGLGLIVITVVASAVIMLR